MGQSTSRAFPNSGVANNLTENATFGPIPLQGARLSIHASWTGTAAGTFSLQSSADGNKTWVTVPGAAAEFTANGQTQPSGGPGSAIWTWYGVPGQTVRLFFTLTGGLGTLTAYATQGD